MNFFWMGINPIGCFLGGMGRKSLVFFKAGRWDFSNFPRKYSFGGVRCVLGKSGI